MDKSRADFEAFWMRVMLNEHERFRYRLERGPDGCYVGTDEQAGWLTWQESRKLALGEVWREFHPHETVVPAEFRAVVLELDREYREGNATKETT